jgi:rSAM/selenodomain-associated transferase 1
VKSRLAAEMGEERALEIYQKLLDHTFAVAAGSGIRTQVWWSESGAGSPFENEIQQGSDLGERMAHAFGHTLNHHSPVIMIGSDCPALDVPLIHEALLMLHRCDVVIGPATDGGYYLIGMSRFYPELFRDIPWSTTCVLNETLIKCRESALRIGTLKVLTDIDERGDLAASGWNVESGMKE